MTTPPIALDLSGATDKQRRAIQSRADRSGVSFEDAALQMLLEHADKVEKQEQQRQKTLFERFFRLCEASHE